MKLLVQEFTVVFQKESFLILRNEPLFGPINVVMSHCLGP